jgi:hypothetical protein
MTDYRPFLGAVSEGCGGENKFLGRIKARKGSTIQVEEHDVYCHVCYNFLLT